MRGSTKSLYAMTIVRPKYIGTIVHPAIIQWNYYSYHFYSVKVLAIGILCWQSMCFHMDFFHHSTKHLIACTDFLEVYGGRACVHGYSVTLWNFQPLVTLTFGHIVYASWITATLVNWDNWCRLNPCPHLLVGTASGCTHRYRPNFYCF